MSFSKSICLSVIMSIFFINTACSQHELVEESSAHNQVHDLNDINTKSKRILEEFNSKNNTQWKSLEADPRTLVSKCTNPLKAIWSSAPEYYSKEDKSYFYIKVHCEKNSYNRKSWDVFVSTNRPI